jgi:hypothetical protein
MPRDALAEEHVKAMLAHVSERSVAIFTDGPNETPAGLGSGTCIEIGGVFLVATAAHVLLDTTLKQVTVVGSVTRTDLAPRLIACGHRGGGAHDAVDVGWIQLDPRAAKAIGKTFVPLDRLSLEAVELASLSWIYGYPSERLDRRGHKGKPWYLINAIGYLTQVRKGTNAASASPEHDVFLDWPDDVNEEAPSGWLKQTPNAPGLSGAGIWQVNTHSKQLWSPESARLVAIECSWSREYRWLRGTLVGHWLKMVAEDLPQLAAVIEPVLAAPPKATEDL